MAIGVIGATSSTTDILPVGAVEKIATIRCDRGVISLPTLQAGRYIFEGTTDFAVAKSGSPIALGASLGATVGSFELSEEATDLEAEIVLPRLTKRASDVTGLNTTIYDLASCSEDDLFLVGKTRSSQNSFRVSEDGGLSWVSRSAPFSATSFTVDSAKNIYCFSLNGNIQISTNKGVSFSTFNVSPPSGFTTLVGFAAHGGQWLSAWVSSTSTVAQIEVRGGIAGSPSITKSATLSVNSLNYGANTGWVQLFGLPSNPGRFLVATRNSTSTNQEARSNFTVYQVDFREGFENASNFGGISNVYHSSQRADIAFPIQPFYYPNYSAWFSSSGQLGLWVAGVGLDPSSPTSLGSINKLLAPFTFGNNTFHTHNPGRGYSGYRGFSAYSVRGYNFTLGSAGTISYRPEEHVSGAVVNGEFYENSEGVNIGPAASSLSDLRSTNTAWVLPSGRVITLKSGTGTRESEEEYISIYRAV